MTDVAMLYGGGSPHPVHKGFAESVGADLIQVPQFTLGTAFCAIRDRSRFFYPQYDVLISEGTGALEVGIANKLFRETILVFLAGGHGIHLLDSESEMEVNSSVKSTAVNVFPGVVQSLLSRNIDGVIAVSDLAAELTSRVTGQDIPLKVVHPYIPY
ncbi:MAG: hexosyltransferase, partial [Halobacteriaceae archaeon]